MEAYAECRRNGNAAGCNDTQADVTVQCIVAPGCVSDDAYDAAMLPDDRPSSLSEKDLADGARFTGPQ